MSSLKIALQYSFQNKSIAEIRTEKDLPYRYIILGTLSMLAILFWVFQHTINLNALGLSETWHVPFLVVCLLYITIISFIFAAICGYFSGLVGVTATPGSAIVIAGLLLTATLLKLMPETSFSHSPAYLLEIAAIIILVGCVITGIAAIANDNIQDLKTGHLLGATPWKQQVMLLFGTLISAAIIPLLMQLLFSVYGIGDVLPRPGMDQTHALATPPAMMMATIASHYHFPWHYMLTGAIVIGIFIIINRY